MKRLLAPLVCLAVALTLTGCGSPAADPEASPSATEEYRLGGDSTEPTSRETAPEDPSAPAIDPNGAISYLDLPELPLLGCGAVRGHEFRETEFDRQWRIELLCEDRARYDGTVAAMGSQYAITVDVRGGER